jgi:hypothetical protein
MNTLVNVYLGGAIMTACWVASLFFLKFWKRTRDGFFGAFALAFFILGLERVVLAYTRAAQETTSPAVYLMRLAAFLVIIAAILHKNIEAKK